MTEDSVDTNRGESRRDETPADRGTGPRREDSGESRPTEREPSIDIEGKAPEPLGGEERDDVKTQEILAEMESSDNERVKEIIEHGHAILGSNGEKPDFDDVRRRGANAFEEKSWEEGQFGAMRKRAEELRETALPEVTTFSEPVYEDNDAPVTALENQVVSGIEEGRTPLAIVEEKDGWGDAGIGGEYTHPQLVQEVEDTEHYDTISHPDIEGLPDIVTHRARVHDTAQEVKGRVQNKIEELRTKEHNAESRAEYRNAQEMKDELSSERMRLSGDIGELINTTGNEIEQVYESEIRLEDRLGDVNDTVGVVADNFVNVFEELEGNLSVRANDNVTSDEPGESRNPNKPSAGTTENLDLLYDTLEDATETLGGPFQEDAEGMLDHLVDATTYFEDVVTAASETSRDFYNAVRESSSLPAYEHDFKAVLDSGYVTRDGDDITYGERAEELAEYTQEFIELRSTNPGSAMERAEDIVEELS